MELYSLKSKINGDIYVKGYAFNDEYVKKSGSEAVIDYVELVGLIFDGLIVDCGDPDVAAVVFKIEYHLIGSLLGSRFAVLTDGDKVWWLGDTLQSIGLAYQKFVALLTHSCLDGTQL